MTPSETYAWSTGIGQIVMIALICVLVHFEE